MRKKLLGIGLLVLGLFGMVFGAAAAYQGIPGNTAQTTGGSMCGGYLHEGYMHGHDEDHGKGAPQFMGLGVKGQYLEEAEIDEGQVREYLSGATIEKFVTPRGITVQRLVLDGQYVGKIVGNHDLGSLEVYKAYNTQNGIKVFLSYDGSIVGFFLMK